MNILITGAKGFAGKNLVANLHTIKDGKNRTRPNIHIDEIFEYDIDSTPDELREYCSKADFIFHLAGINRPKETSEFAGNYGILGTVLDELKACSNKAPVMLSSSVQATLEGRFAGSEYGKSKLEAENMLLEAVNLGLGGLWNGVAPEEERMAKIGEIIGIDDITDTKPYCIITLGYPAEGWENKFMDKFDEERIHYEKY